MNFLENCRICLKSDNNTALTLINESIEQLFYELTQTKLKYNLNYTYSACEKCLKDLQYCNDIRKSFIYNQNEFEKTIKIETEIKNENENDQEENRNWNSENYDESIQNQSVDLAECPECLELFHSSEITKHINTRHTKATRYFCDKCGYSAAKLQRLENHCQKIHTCSAPPKKSTRKPEQGISSKRVQSQCSQCGLMIKNPAEHMNNFHSRIKRYYCDYCSYSCYFKTKIARHLVRHIPKKYRNLIKCQEEECGFYCSRKDALKSHMLTMHQKDRKRSYDCFSDCGKSFFSKSQLNIHIKSVHEKIKNNLCNFCGRSFFNAKDLQMHSLRHFEKKEQCSECSSVFFCKVDLKRHFKNKHTEANIVCHYPNCERKFHTNSKLKNHIKTRHEHLKEYVCSFCDSKFSQYNNLKRHIDTVHKALRISCVVENCNYSVSRKDKYKLHLSTQHKHLDEQTRDSIMKNIRYE